jgi:hypothetical protein
VNLYNLGSVQSVEIDARYDDNIFARTPPIYALNRIRSEFLFSTQGFYELSCGAFGLSFAFPTLLIERKSDQGNYYVAQNQLIGGLKMYD